MPSIFKVLPSTKKTYQPFFFILLVFLPQRKVSLWHGSTGLVIMALCSIRLLVKSDAISKHYNIYFLQYKYYQYHILLQAVRLSARFPLLVIDIMKYSKSSG